MEGIVVSFDRDKSSGFIKGENGEIFYTHSEHSNIGDFSVLSEGMEVKFIPVEGNPEKERIATNVTLKF